MNQSNSSSTMGTVNPRALWVIVMIKIARYVDGMNRLQKYAFVLCKTIKNLDRVGLYNDWIAGEYGPYSQKLYDDVELLKKEGIIHVDDIKNEFGSMMERYTTNVGKDVIDQLQNNYSEKEYNEVINIFKKIINQYSNKPNIDLLYDIYSKFPQYAVPSRQK